MSIFDQNFFFEHHHNLFALHKPKQENFSINLFGDDCFFLLGYVEDFTSKF